MPYGKRKTSLVITRLCIIIACTALLHIPCNTFADSFGGRVIKIIDGDTLDVMSGTTTVRVRLADIDAPDPGQPYAVEAARYLAEIAMGEEVIVDTHDIDEHGRYVATLLLNDASAQLNSEMIHQGYAWWDGEHSENLALLYVEMEAAAAMRGLFSQENPTAPWDYRSGQRTTRKFTADDPVHNQSWKRKRIIRWFAAKSKRQTFQEQIVPLSASDPPAAEQQTAIQSTPPAAEQPAVVVPTPGVIPQTATDESSSPLPTDTNAPPVKPEIAAARQRDRGPDIDPILVDSEVGIEYELSFGHYRNYRPHFITWGVTPQLATSHDFARRHDAFIRGSLANRSNQQRAYTFVVELYGPSRTISRPLLGTKLFQTPTLKPGQRCSFQSVIKVSDVRLVNDGRVKIISTTITAR